MVEIYGAQGETESLRGDESSQELRLNTDSSEDAGRTGTGAGTQCLSLDRENSSARDILGYAVGGIIDQLISDAESQLVKSRECVIWYQSEVEEFEKRLQRFKQLKEIHQQQAAAEAEDPESP